MNPIILSYNNLPIAQQNNMFSSNNILLKRTPINQKPSNSSNTNKVLDPTLDSSSCFYNNNNSSSNINNNNINTIVEITPIKVDFYKEVIKTMDNFEIRYYPPTIKAKVSSNRNFSKLFQRIENAEKKIEIII